MQRAAMRGHAARVVERLEPAQQVARGCERRARRRVEPVERARVRAPDRELERERREIGRRDLGRCMRRERALRALAPDSIADAGRGAAGPAGALLGRGARDPLRLEPAHARARIEHAAPLEARIDDGADAVDREAGLGDVGREHDLATIAARGLERRVLLGRRQVAVERQDIDVRADAAPHRGASARGESRRRPAGTRADRRPLPRARAARPARRPHPAAPLRARAGPAARASPCRHSAPRRGTRARRARSPERRRAAARRRRRRAWRTSRARAVPARRAAARRERTRGRRRRSGCARGIRRRSRPPRRRARGRSAASA